ncbi:MAG TPA: hypothetical protein VEK15_05180 [Vicinamibacteria bacterium]|nr:hypothetical protein [Vicinamibacteria bacterium]
MSQRREFLHVHMSQWMTRLAETGRIEYLFELEMWLRSFERYFRVRNQPLSEDSARTLAIRSFYEEIGLVAHAIERVTKLCTLLSSEDQVSQERFEKYVENFLKEDDIADPYVARLLRQASPQAALTLLRESFEDLKLLLTELSKLSRIPYPTFQSIGRLLYREIRRNDYLGLIMGQRFKPVYDRIGSEAVVRIIRNIDNRGRRRLVANIFLQLFRLLHYLEYADPRKRHLEELRTSVLIFSLVASETRSLVDFIQKQQARLGPDTGFPETFESFIYCVPLELRKVIHTELAELVSFKQADTIYMRLENSHGILRDCFQQSVIQLAQGLEPTIRGNEIFDHFHTHFEQSQTLRHDLLALVVAVRRFSEEKTEERAESMKRFISRFHDRSLRYLMYRDWASFESFASEILKCDNVAGMLQISHRFDTYLRTLLREVNKRGVLQGGDTGVRESTTSESAGAEGVQPPPAF